MIQKSRMFLSWSGGKDSALSLYRAKENGLVVERLLTTVNSETDRVSMHGVRQILLAMQSKALGLPLQTVYLPEMPGMNAYEEAMQTAHKALKKEGFSHGIFGDVYLEDLKVYRQALLQKDGLEALFPIWKMDPKQVVHRFIKLGFKAVVVCTQTAMLPPEFCGRLLDENFLSDLPPNVDPCGENGEYHSFVFDGPLFSEPVPFTIGATVAKEYPAPKSADDCFAAPQPASRFCFTDLLPV